MPGEGACRAADLEIFPAGDGMSLVYARDSGNAGLFRAEIVSLLVSCREFRTIDEHLQACFGSDLAGGRAPMLRRELIRLCRAGFLVGAEALRIPAGQDPHRSPPICSLAIPTCDRAGADRAAVLRRAVSSYAENLARHGRRIDLVVADDASGADARAGCLALLAELAASRGADIYYAGRAEKAAYAARLARAGQVPEEVVRFCCLPDHRSGGTPGANRNVLLLQTAGQKFLSVDDDTICNVAVPPGHADAPLLDSAGNPLQLWYFGDRREAFAAVRYVDADLVGQHERYLGERPASLLADAGAASLRTADPALLRRLLTDSGRIRVTAGGAVGDCGWDNPDFHLFQDGASFARLTRSPADFAVARASREMIQAVTQPTITGRADPKFAMCVGLDNTELLPPFPPVGRAEEVAFGAVLTLCCAGAGPGGAYTAHLPLLVQHDPAGQRNFAPAGMFAIGLGTWLPACISRFDPGPPGSPADRLSGLGQFLSGLARLPDAKLDEFTRLIRWESMSMLIRGIEERLDGPGPVPDCWASQARQFMARARQEALAPAADAYASLGGRAVLQRLLDQFGQLLIWWPAIVGAARQLGAAGDRPARPVRDLL